MNTIGEAWRWYQSTRDHLQLFQRLARKYWGQLPFEGPLGRDDAFRELKAADVQDAVAFSLGHLDDLAVVVLFSVFEATVRDLTVREIRREGGVLHHPALRGAVREAGERIEVGSFFQVLEYYKEGVDPNLIEEVNQVRRYRNWVSHGKRGAPAANVEPEVAYDRLRRFLSVLGVSVESAPMG
jgi:hypothetical protein